MTVEDANITPDAVQSTTVVVDEQKIIDGLFQRLAQSAPVTAPASPSPEQNAAAVDIYRSLKAQGLSDEIIAGQLSAAARMEKEIESKVNGAVGQVLNYKRDSDINANVNRYIRDISKDEPRFKALGPLIHDRFAQSLNSNPDRQREMRQGFVNDEAHEKLLDQIAEDLSKEMGWEKKAVNAAMPGKSNQKEQTAAVTNERSTDGFTDHQEEFYNARVESLMKWGKLSKEEAEKKAYDTAKAMPAPTFKKPR